VLELPNILAIRLFAPAQSTPCRLAEARLN